MPIKTKPVETVVVEETQNVQTTDQAEVVEAGEVEASNEATNENANASTSETPKRRGAPKGVSRGPGYPWQQFHYDIMKEEAQKQAKANGGVVNLSQLHKRLLEIEEFISVPMELKELTLRNFYSARRDQLKEWPKGTFRTPEQVNAILPPVGGTRAKLQLA